MNKNFKAFANYIAVFSGFGKPKLKGEELKKECFRLIDKWENAESEEEVLQAETEYCALYTLRTSF